jgi:GH15 family glucan-1,4-alpha-glucosidase
MIEMTGLTIVSYTQHWVRIDGAWYREAWVRDASGQLRYVGILDEDQ